MQTNERVSIQRTPVGEQKIETIEQQCFREPMWLEAPQGSRLEIMPHQGLMNRYFSLQRSTQERAICSAPTLADLIAIMRQQEWTRRVLSEDERLPLRDWHIAKPVIGSE